MIKDNARVGKPRLVIVGASFSGLTLTHELYETYDITLIERKEHFEYTPLVPKSLTISGIFKEKAALKYSQMLGNKNSLLGRATSQGLNFVQGNLTALNVADKTVEVQRNGTDSTESIEFDYVCLCTGATFNSPINSKDITVEGRQEFLEDFQKKISGSESILVVGAGASGIEVAGKLAEIHKDKKIGLFNRDPKLLPQFGETAHELMIEKVENAGIELFSDAGDFDPNGEIAKSYDHVITCVGSSQNSNFLQDGLDRFTDEQGRIQVNQHYQLTNHSPHETILMDNEYYISESDESLKSDVKDNETLESIFSVGDACVTIMGEGKNIPALQYGTGIVANNFKLLASDPHATLNKMPLVPAMLAGIPFDSNGGVMVMNDIAMVKPEMDQVKDGYYDGFVNYLKGEEGGAEGYTQALAESRGFLQSLMFSENSDGLRQQVESSISSRSKLEFINFIKKRLVR